MQIKIENATLEHGWSNAVITLDLGEIREAIVMLLATKGIKAQTDHVHFLHESDYDSREVSGATIGIIAVKIEQAP